jgi:hypothetical protein
MDATANNAITVLLNITILRQRYRSQSRSSLQVAIVSEIAISFDEPIAQVFASRAGLNLKLEIKSEVRKRFTLAARLRLQSNSIRNLASDRISDEESN